MVSAELLNRLRELEQAARRQSLSEENPKKALGFREPWAAVEQRLLKLWNEVDGRVTDKKAKELYTLLRECVIYQKSANGYDVEISNLSEEDLSLIISLHQFSRVYPSVSIPYLSHILQEYLLKTVRRLFAKYGWTKGHRDCSAILPLEEWAPDDRRMLVDLYR